MVSARTALLLVALGVAFLGCAHSRVEEHWGEAQEELVTRMVANPEAEQAPAQAVEGLDPGTGEAVVEKYEQNQRESREPSQLPSIIQIESGGSR
jgi:hypothetical protein